MFIYILWYDPLVPHFPDLYVCKSQKLDKNAWREKTVARRWEVGGGQAGSLCSRWHFGSKTLSVIWEEDDNKQQGDERRKCAKMEILSNVITVCHLPCLLATSDVKPTTSFIELLMFIPLSDLSTACLVVSAEQSWTI